LVPLGRGCGSGVGSALLFVWPNGFSFLHRRENKLRGERMSFTMNCPHCKRALNITEKAFGKTAPCPGCNQPVTVPQQPGTSSSSQSPAGVQAAPRQIAPPPTVVSPPSALFPKMPPAPNAPTPLPPREDGGVRPSIASPTHSVARIKIPCPFCGDSIKYEESLGGKTILCDYCKRALKIPFVAQLAPEYQEEFRHAQDKMRKKEQDAELKRLKAQQKEEKKKQAQEDAQRRATEELAKQETAHAQRNSYVQPPAFAQQPQQVQQVIVNVTQPPKSALVAFLLAFLFGPLGMLYSTVVGALIMLVVSVVLAIFTLGFSLLLTQPICCIWAAIEASRSR